MQSSYFVNTINNQYYIRLSLTKKTFITSALKCCCKTAHLLSGSPEDPEGPRLTQSLVEACEHLFLDWKCDYPWLTRTL